MVKSVVCCALAAAMLALAGCATIVHGTTEKVHIDSNPGGADVQIDDSQHVTTPASVKLSRGSPHKLVFHKPGYQDDTETLTSSPSGWILGNLIGGGVIGIAVDSVDGAGRKLSSDNVNATLRPAQAPGAAASSAAASPAAAQRRAPLPGSASSEPSAPRDYTDDEADYAAPSSAGLQPASEPDEASPAPP
jgi:hypothetical protein